MEKQEDCRVHFSQDNVEGLKKYAEAERKRFPKNAVMQDLITWKSLANHIVSNELKKRGYYAGVKKV
jgi:hypothetical protein